MRGPLGAARPLSLAALDAAISETIGKPVRRDRLARDDRLYRWVVRRAIAEGSLRFRTTYAEAAAGAGYRVPRLNCRPNRRRAREQRQSTVYRALSSLEAAGLVRFHGVKRSNGQWRCLSVGLTPAAFGPTPPFGRSRRAPRRRPDGRISFSRRNGSSPPVATAKNRPRGVGVRAGAREGPPEAGEEGMSAFLAAALAARQTPAEPSGPRSWPNERFDLPDPELVEVVELFEEAFGLQARFSFERHGPFLRRILDRFDRFSGSAAPGGGDQRGRREGVRRARALLKQKGRSYRAGNIHLQKVRSLPYFLPQLNQQSRTARREWRKRHGFTTWA